MKEEILVVDDERQLLMAVHETLERKGYSVTTATNGVEAIRKLRDGHFQLMISDVRMPHMDGLELLQRARQLAPQTPVVLLTAYATVENAVEAMRFGAKDYLLKPFTSSQLLGAVERYIAKISEGATQSLIIGTSKIMGDLMARARQAAESDATILILAESGTGIVLLAHYIHSNSPRIAGPFVAVNCAAMPEMLLESELFGHEKGSFSGAVAAKPGKFELAHGGTILLDEISEMLPMLQAKLLRVLQEREIDRVGAIRAMPIDVRVISTTNRRLADMLSSGSFRSDLYYRLNVVPLSIPPLRERKEDIPALVHHFCDKYSRDCRSEFAPETLELLGRYDWPGNVRELENVIHRSLVMNRKPVIYPADLFLERDESTGSAVTVRSLHEMEKKMILSTLEETGDNRTKAAAILGVTVRTLRNKLKEYAS
jgi:DNA-binding NtrC family response regulator